MMELVICNSSQTIGCRLQVLLVVLLVARPAGAGLLREVAHAARTVPLLRPSGPEVRLLLSVVLEPGGQANWPASLENVVRSEPKRRIWPLFSVTRAHEST